MAVNKNKDPLGINAVDEASKKLIRLSKELLKTEKQLRNISSEERKNQRENLKGLEERAEQLKEINTLQSLSTRGLKEVGKEINEQVEEEIKSRQDIRLGLELTFKPLKELLGVQKEIQRQVLFTNIGYEGSFRLVNQIMGAVAETGGLLDLKTAQDNIQSLTSVYQDFGSSAITSINQLNAGLGFSASASAKFALTLKAMKGERYEDVFVEISDSIALATKNTNMNTEEVQQLISSMDTLVVRFPKELENNLIPSILAVGGALKEVGLDPTALSNALTTMTDLSSTQGVLMAAMASTKGTVSFDEILSGQEVNQTVMSMSDSIRELYDNFSGGRDSLKGLASELTTTFYDLPKEMIDRIANMDDAEYRRFQERLRQDQEFNDAAGALQETMNQRLEVPLETLTALTNNFKLMILNSGAALSNLVKYVSPILELANKTMSFLAKLESLGIVLAGVGTYLSLRLTPSIMNWTKSMIHLATVLPQVIMATDAYSRSLRNQAMTSAVGTKTRKRSGGLGLIQGLGIGMMGKKAMQKAVTWGVKLGLKRLLQVGLNLIPVVGSIASALWIGWDILSTMFGWMQKNEEEKKSERRKENEKRYTWNPGTLADIQARNKTDMLDMAMALQSEQSDHGEDFDDKIYQSMLRLNNLMAEGFEPTKPVFEYDPELYNILSDRSGEEQIDVLKNIDGSLKVVAKNGEYDIESMQHLEGALREGVSKIDHNLELPSDVKKGLEKLLDPESKMGTDLDPDVLEFYRKASEQEMNPTSEANNLEHFKQLIQNEREWRIRSWKQMVQSNPENADSPDANRLEDEVESLWKLQDHLEDRNKLVKQFLSQSPQINRLQAEGYSADQSKLFRDTSSNINELENLNPSLQQKQSNDQNLDRIIKSQGFIWGKLSQDLRDQTQQLVDRLETMIENSPKEKIHERIQKTRVRENELEKSKWDSSFRDPIIQQ